MIPTLNLHPLFALLTMQEITTLSKIARNQVFMAHESLIRIGERTRDVLCLIEGSVSVQIENAEGEIIEITRLHEGSLIGEMNFIIPSRRTANVVALTEVEAGIFPYQDFCKLLAVDAQLAGRVFAALNIQLTQKYLNTLRGL